MPKIENIEQLHKTLQGLRGRAKEASEASVTVGFTQRYALFVHENKEAHHNVGQAKFLEQPARQKADELAEITRTGFKKTGSMEKGLLLAGLRLQREAQLLVPVDTGALKGSAFTSLTKDEEAAAEAAFVQSEAIRGKALLSRAKRKGKK